MAAFQIDGRLRVDGMTLSQALGSDNFDREKGSHDLSGVIILLQVGNLHEGMQ